MITFELAKKLKKVGFPFHAIANGKEAWDGKVFVDEDLQAYALPTLEELIEACTMKADKRSKGNISLYTMWYGQGHFTKCSAIYWRGISKEDALYGTGDTFSEAVAKLWLELNKK